MNLCYLIYLVLFFKAMVVSDCVLKVPNDLSRQILRSLQWLLQRIQISSSCLSLKETIYHLTIYVLYMVSFTISVHECFDARIKICKPLVFKQIVQFLYTNNLKCFTLSTNHNKLYVYELNP